MLMLHCHVLHVTAVVDSTQLDCQEQRCADLICQPNNPNCTTNCLGRMACASSNTSSCAPEALGHLCIARNGKADDYDVCGVSLAPPSPPSPEPPAPSAGAARNSAIVSQSPPPPSPAPPPSPPSPVPSPPPTYPPSPTVQLSSCRAWHPDFTGHSNSSCCSMGDMRDTCEEASCTGNRLGKYGGAMCHRGQQCAQCRSTLSDGSI
jgi:hypothetical protein